MPAQQQEVPAQQQEEREVPAQQQEVATRQQDWRGLVARARIHTIRKQKEMTAGTCWLSPFYSLWDLSLRANSPTFKLSLSPPVNPLWKHPYKCF